MTEIDIDAIRYKILGKGDVRVVAIDGRGASGKSVLANAIADGWDRATVIQMDDFYLPKSRRELPPASHGAHFDLERVADHVLIPHSHGKASQYQRYDWDTDSLSEWLEVPADTILILEGVYSMCKTLRHYSQFRIWMNAPYETRIERAIERDGQGMLDFWVEEWMPAEDAYIEEEDPAAIADLSFETG